MALEISQLPATPGVALTDLLASKKSTNDYKVTVQQVADLVLNQLTASQIITLFNTQDGSGSGTDSDLLDGQQGSYYLNRSNHTGNIPSGALPSGLFSENFVAGGNLSTGRNNIVLRFPNFIFGENIMVQFGYSNYYTSGQTYTVNFSQAFASGFGSDDKPIVILSPECRRDGWNGTISGKGGQNIELRTRLWYASKTQFRATADRDEGSGTDYVRANYIAIGRY